VGTYEWVAVYSGDSENNGATSTFGDESWIVAAAQPSMTTTPGGTVAIGSGVHLTDSALLSNGASPGGTITFYLFAPGVIPNFDNSNNIYSDTVSVTGNGTYMTDSGTNPGGYLPTAAGTYQWVAVYSGDTANNAFTSTFGDEPEAVTAGT
jgi:hypothetical protein